MTGKEFLEKVRETKEIKSIEWETKGDPFNADELRVKVIADNGEYNLSLGSPATMTKEELLEETWFNRVCICLLVNKLMELQGKEERFNVGCDLGISKVINYTIQSISDFRNERGFTDDEN